MRAEGGVAVRPEGGGGVDVMPEGGGSGGCNVGLIHVTARWALPSSLPSHWAAPGIPCHLR